MRLLSFFQLPADKEYPELFFRYLLQPKQHNTSFLEMHLINNTFLVFFELYARLLH